MKPREYAWQIMPEVVKQGGRAIDVIAAQIALAMADTDTAARAEQREEDAAKLIGWRENDWPEGFDRRTAEILAQHIAAAIRNGSATGDTDGTDEGGETR